ncbi:hypothetical protein V6N13_138641 [Hibiscus sabdariffa]|uniref:AP2/ERF domain-containing protein n=1 Tax=Hibiscus sabdariffa TaxID=183260 RepID=A0ABR2PJP9_9ROSI
MMAKNSHQNRKNHAENENSAAKPTTKLKRTRKTAPQRSSTFRGVTRHRLTGRFEAHLWDKNCWNESQTKKGRQVYLGAYADEEAAAHAYDLAALKYWGHETLLNFPLSTYENELKEMEGQSREEYIGSLRRKSSGFARGVSKYRGTTTMEDGKLVLAEYLEINISTLEPTQEEAAMAYDMAAIEHRGPNAVTNFDLSRYIDCVRSNYQNKTNVQQNLNRDIDSMLSPKRDIESQIYYTSDSRLINSDDSSNSTSLVLEHPLRSSILKDMLERTSAVACPLTSSKSDAPRRSFPDDIQTCFDYQDVNDYIKNDSIIFGHLDSLTIPLFYCELDG